MDTSAHSANEHREDRVDYLAAMRRTFHRCPEIGFDLPDTYARVTQAIDQIGLEHTQSYGRYSVVAVLGKRTDVPTIAVRADMDALPVEEQTGLSYASENPGRMHACGHDAHMAMLLGAARTLKPLEAELPFRLKMIFQPSEEGAVSGAQQMVELGVLDDVDYVLGQHVAPELDTGTAAVARGAVCSACTAIELTFRGKTSHATLPHQGHDALAMLVKTYNNIQLILSREIDPFERVVCSVGAINGGLVHNVICDRATMQISLRTYDSSWRDFIVSRIQMLADHAAEELGGSVDCMVHYSSPAVVNDDQLVDCFVQASNTLLGDAGAREVRPKMGSDDFAWYTTKKPSLYYWLGVRNSARWPEKALHNNDFMLDEDALLIGEKLLIELLYTIGQNLNR